SDSSQVSMGCLVTGYFPEPVTVQWNSGAISTGIQTFPAVFDSSNSRYTLSSQLTVSASSWKSEKFQCTVEHVASSSTLHREIRCKFCQVFLVCLHPP
uniref:Ig-like domain-containing protein n=1 Tax=Varanus komodoensis TaxID=61221 RepID=A0A8D2LH31_VARKO